MTGSNIVAARRRAFFAACKAAVIDEDTQRLIADRFIPDHHPGKFNIETGALSRRPIFESPAIFNSVMDHLNGKNRRTRRDKLPATAIASRAMFNRASALARRLGWAERGEDDLRFRLQQFASRQVGDHNGFITLFDSLTSAQLMRVIEGLKAMLKRKNNASPISGARS